MYLCMFRFTSYLYRCPCVLCCCAPVFTQLSAAIFIVNIYAWSADIIYLTQALLKHVMILVKTKMVDSQFIVKKYM